MRRLAFMLALVPMVGLGCSPAPERVAEGPAAQSLARAASESGVPRDLLVAIAVVEGGLMLAPSRLPDPADHVPVAGALELRHGAFDSLARGATLAHSDELTLRADTELATRAGALVLAELGAATGARSDDLGSWRAALATLSGMGDDAGRARYAADVFTLLRAGGVFPARGGESVMLAAHPDLAVPSTTTFSAASTPEFPGAIWFTTSCSGKCDTTRTAGNSVVDMIVIHDTEGGWNASVATLQNDAGKSVHYIVDADGSRVGQFVPESYTAWHAGNYYYNQRSVGIEHVGTAADPNGYADGLYAKSTALVKSIRTRWTVPLDRAHIVGHYQIPDGNVLAESAPACSDTLGNCETSASYGGADNHRDPGYNWQWCQYMQGLGGSCDCNDAYPLWNCTTDKKQAVRCLNGKVEIESCAKGCVSQPIGQNDVCNMAAGGGGSGGSGGGDMGGGGVTGGDAGGQPLPSGGDDGGTSGSGNGGSNNGGGNGASGGNKADNPHGVAGGCSMSGDAPVGGAGMMLAFILAIACARIARRRRAPAS